MKADLHIHTTESDGRLTVEEVLAEARKSGLTHLALTDHETTAGVDKAVKAGSDYGIEVIPGIEFNTIYGDEEIHLLAYYRTIDNDRLQENLERIRRERTDITRQMVDKLCRNGLRVNWQDVVKEASPGGLVCKTHIMYALMNTKKDFERIDWNSISSLFKPGGLAYIPYYGNRFEYAVDLIFDTGGLPVLAHPGLIRKKSLIKELLSYKSIGLEVYYGYWENREKQIKYFEAMSKDAVLTTGGSDYHGFFSPVGIGQIDLPEKCGLDLLNYLGL